MRDAARMLALEPGVESSAAHVQFGWSLADKSDGLWQYLVKRKMLDGNALECCSICPHTPLYVPSYSSVCALILLYMSLCVSTYSSKCALILPHMCPHTAVHVSSYCCVCALIMLLQTCLPDSGQTSRMPYALR